jgi:hypothetical protein
MCVDGHWALGEDNIAAERLEPFAAFVRSSPD